MGLDAVWNENTGKVLLKEPTKEDMINGENFSPFHRIMEWRKGVFDGLFDAIRAASDLIEVTIDDVEYYVADGAAKYDGKTYRAVIYPK